MNALHCNRPNYSTVLSCCVLCKHSMWSSVFRIDSWWLNSIICLLCIIILLRKSTMCLLIENRRWKCIMICFPFGKVIGEKALFHPYKWRFSFLSTGLWPTAHCWVSREMSECRQVVIISALIFLLQVHQHNKNSLHIPPVKVFMAYRSSQLTLSGDQLKTHKRATFITF